MHAAGSTLNAQARRLRQCQKALEAFDINCPCKGTLVFGCVLDKTPRCHRYRTRRSCCCALRALPICLLDDHAIYGCLRWRDGKNCRCPRQLIPRCFVTGCELRQQGHKCGCPRTTLGFCPHVLALRQRFAALTPQEAEAYCAEWIAQQRRINPKRYADPPLADRGGNVSTRQAAIALKIIRADGGLCLWHPDDYGLASRMRIQDPARQPSRQQCEAFLRLLCPARKAVTRG
jgi:hypothetical protein